MALFFFVLTTEISQIMIESEKIELFILRQLNNELSVEEQAELTSWINRSDKNRSFYQKQVELFKAQRLIFSANDIALSREKTKTGVINQLLQRSSKVKRFVYASLTVMVVGLVVSTLLFNTTIQERNNLLAGEFRIMAPEGSPASFRLPDGTEVWLNASSELSYSYNADSKSRLASIEGEAFFNVAHDASQAFLVTGYNHTVKVYGTEFNIKSNRQSKQCEVTLREGAVGILNTKQEEIARLKPGQQFSVDAQGGASIRNVESVNAVTDWTTGRYEFKDATLNEIAAKLSELYHVNIIIEDDVIKQQRYRCVIQKEQSILKTLQRFSIITNLDYEINNEVIILKQK